MSFTAATQKSTLAEATTLDELNANLHIVIQANNNNWNQIVMYVNKREAIEKRSKKINLIVNSVVLVVLVVVLIVCLL